MFKLLVGLGNPGPEYDATRHNAGFWWLDAVAQRLGAHWQLDRNHFGRVARTSVGGHTLWLLQPMTFMNRSGQSVGSLARFFKIDPSEVLVAHDELDLPPGEAKLKRGGGHAGHNGLRDIHAQLGSADYWRLRLGIGHPGDKSQVANWVLKKPSPDERIAIEQTLDRCSDALPELLAGEMDRATAKIHTSKPPRPKPPRPNASSGPEANTALGPTTAEGPGESGPARSPRVAPPATDSPGTKPDNSAP